MENAVDALKIAFATLVFVIAITVTFSVIAQAKSTSDYVLYYSDETNFYEHLYSKEDRTVSLAEVIANLHKYYKETMAVTVCIGTDTYTFDLNNNESIHPDYTGLYGKSKVYTDKDRKQNLEYIVEEIKSKVSGDANPKFSEEFVEMPISRYI